MRCFSAPRKIRTQYNFLPLHLKRYFSYPKLYCPFLASSYNMLLVNKLVVVAFLSLCSFFFATYFFITSVNWGSVMFPDSIISIASLKPESRASSFYFFNLIIAITFFTLRTISVISIIGLDSTAIRAISVIIRDMITNII